MKNHGNTKPTGMVSYIVYTNIKGGVPQTWDSLYSIFVLVIILSKFWIVFTNRKITNIILSDFSWPLKSLKLKGAGLRARLRDNVVVLKLVDGVNPP